MFNLRFAFVDCQQTRAIPLLIIASSSITPKTSQEYQGTRGSFVFILTRVSPDRPSKHTTRPTAGDVRLLFYLSGKERLFTLSASAGVLRRFFPLHEPKSTNVYVPSAIDTTMERPSSPARPIQTLVGPAPTTVIEIVPALHFASCLTIVNYRFTDLGREDLAER